MPRLEWNVARAAIWGALFGAPLGVLRRWISGELASADVEAIVAFLVAGAVDGALLLAVVATIRNAFVR